MADALAAADAARSTGSIVVDTEHIDGVLRSMVEGEYVGWAEHEYEMLVTGKAVGDLFRRMWQGAAQRFWNRIRDRKLRMIRETTQRDLSSLYAASGGDPIILAAAIRTQRPELFDRRANLIAGTESVAVSEGGRLSGAIAAGATTKAWFATLDNRTRRGERGFDHAAAHMQYQHVVNPFVVSGEFLMHPGDGTMGASAGNLVNCRCATLFA